MEVDTKMWDFLKQLTFENHIQPHVDIANVILIFIIGIASGVAVGEYRAHRKQSKEEADREKRRADTEREISREASSKELYRDYLKVALENPDLSSGNYDETNSLVADKYDTFLSIMLYAFDEMVDLLGPEYWRDVVKNQVRVHEKYLRSILHKDLPERDSYRSAYGAKLLDIVDEAFDEIDKERELSSSSTRVS